MTAALASEDHLARPNWEYIRVDVLLPEHPKVEGLSDRAFRALVELWCYCGRQRTDGIVTGRQWKAVPPKARAELVACGLADEMPLGGAVMHDFTEHQRSRAEIDELAEKRSDKARNAANARWGKERPPLHAPSTCSEHAPSIAQAHAPRCLRQRQRQRHIKPRSVSSYR